MPERFDHFGLFAPFYDHVFGLLDPVRLRALLRLPIAGCLLDAAGGTGRVAAALSDAARQIVVADLSAAMLRQAARKPRLQPTRAHIERLPFPDGAFERILMVDAFHHLCDPREAARDLLRVLAPGGRLVIEEPDIAALPIKLIALGERLLLMRSRFYAPADMRRMFEAEGGRVTIESDHPYNAWIIVERA